MSMKAFGLIKKPYKSFNFINKEKLEAFFSDYLHLKRSKNICMLAAFNAILATLAAAFLKIFLAFAILALMEALIMVYLMGENLRKL